MPACLRNSKPLNLRDYGVKYNREEKYPIERREGGLAMNKRKYCLPMLTTFLILSVVSVLSAQTKSTSSSSRSTRSTGGTSNFRQNQGDNEERKGAVRDFVMAVIGGMLRHPDPTIRKQTIQAISSGMIGGDNNTNANNEGGIRSLFAVGDERGGGSGKDETSTGVGGAVFIPDMYVLLSDPDPEVRDIASVGLDMIFQTDTTLLRFMNDPEPLIRKYAAQIYSKKGFSSSQYQNNTSNSEQNMGQVRDLLALRTMLVHLKHEKEPSVRKSIVDSIEWYIRSGGNNDNRGGNANNQSAGDMFGVDVALLDKYLNDDNAELRKQAIKTIALRESSDDVLMKLMERLRVEQDEEVKKELLTAMDILRTVQYYNPASSK